MNELNADRARRAIIEHTRRLAASAAVAGPDAAVPTTPKWLVTDLVEHVGQVQHWTAEIIERRITDPAQLPTEMAVRPTDPGEWPAWLSRSAQRVATACSDDALDAPVLNAAGDERPGTLFWMANVLNETVVHGVDAAHAAHRAADIDADIAAALIGHHLAMLTSPTWGMQVPDSARAIRGTGQTLQWSAADIADDAGAWFVERRPDGATWQPGTRPADVTVTGPARSLLLTLTRRLSLAGPEAADVRVDGDVDLVRHWLDNTAHIADPDVTAEDPWPSLTVRRRLPAAAERVFTAFVEPEKLAHWFVVDGYRTPADRIRVDATTGGRLNAVMVADADGTEIPFGFAYAEIDPPRRIVLLFDQPAERVTITLDDTDREGVDLTYELTARSAGPAARRGIEDMLDRIEDGIHRNTI